MKENFLKILVVLFSRYNTQANILMQDETELLKKLRKAGFPEADGKKVLDWVAETYERADASLNMKNPTSTRIYHETEETKISAEARGFILFLEKSGVLDVARREVVIDRLMALESLRVDLDDLRCVLNVVWLHDSEDVNLKTLQICEIFAPDPNKRMTIN